VGKVTGFLEIDRRDRKYQPASERVRTWREFMIPLGDEATRDQAARCMNCGVPFCHTGCPVNNQIPDWNDLVYHDDWRRALANLHTTNNFPEFTGRICPAPCEEACTLNITDEPVTIKTIECAIVDRGWQEGWIAPEPPSRKTGRKVAVIGSGPAGLACAQQLARAGHEVHVYERHARPGGLMTFGIPDFKIEKHHVARRVEQMEAEGVTFHCNVHVGIELDIKEVVDGHDAVAIAIGAEQPRDLPIPGRDLNGIHFAMEYLPQQNRRVADEPLGNVLPILANGKHVVVIGGGDTGSDCIGTANRQRALSVTQLEILPRPPDVPDKELTWPDWPLKYRTSSSQEEGVERDFSVMTQKFTGDADGNVKELHCVEVDNQMKPVEGTEFTLKADLVLLAMGFLGPVHDGMIKDLRLELDKRGNVLADTKSYRSSLDKVFACGDARRGQSLVVWAIREGRQCARAIDEFLMGETTLPR